MNGKRAFTLVEIMVVVAILGILATLAIPHFAKARTQVQRNTCLENQRVIISAACTYELDVGSSFSDGDNALILRNTLMDNEYIRRISAFECPASSVEDYDDYVLTYDAKGMNGIRCTVEPDAHSFDWDGEGD